MVNHSLQAVTIPAKTMLCDIFNVDSVKPLVTDDITHANDEPVQSSVPSQQHDKSSFLDMFDHLNETLSESQVHEVKTLLENYSDIFSQHDLDLENTGKIKHYIRLKDNTPFKERSRPIPPCMIQEVRDHLKEM